MRKPASVALWWYARTQQGWRHFPCVWEKEHGVIQPKHGWVRYKGEQVEYPEGRYELRTWEGGRRVYKALSTTHPLEAVQALNRAKREATGTVRSNLHLVGPSIDGYVRDLEKQRKAEMAEKARHVLGEFKTFSSAVAIRGIGRETMLRFHAHLRARGNSERTVADKHQRVKAWLRWCAVDTAFMPPAPKYEETLPNIYEPEEIGAIRRAASDAGDVHMLLCIDLCLKLGLREQEAMHAEWADLRVTSREFRVQGKVRKEWRFAVKDKEQRDVPVPVDLLQSLLAWQGLHPDSVLILGSKRGLPEGHLLRKLKALARNAGLNCGRCEGCQREGHLAECEEWTLHRFRRTYVTGLLRNGMDARTVQQFAGHSDLETTLRYLRPASTTQSQDLVNSIRWG
jgi:integrase